MFQATRRRLALWYTAVTAVLLIVFASGVYLYVRTTLIERIDDTLSHVVEVVGRSLVIEPANPARGLPPRVNIEASFRDDSDSVEDDHIDLEWFDPAGTLLWSTFSSTLEIPLHPNSNGETVHVTEDLLLRQVTQRIEAGGQLLGYLRVSHPWFEVTKPTRQLIRDLALGTALLVGTVAGIGWLLSELAMAPVRESYQRLKQFTADASHELRNPIAVIQTNVQVALADAEPDPAMQQQQLKVIERLTRRLGRLVDDLLFLARQDSGTKLARREAIALPVLLEEVLEEQESIAADKPVSLNLEISPELQQLADAVQIQGDRDQLIRLFTNLIGNAIQYTPANGKVTVSVSRNKHNPTHVQVQVRDTGTGIPAESLPYLFDRFYRVDPARTSDSRSKASGGSGLGLAIAKVITENHHGQIQVDSELGKGTVFTVTLPAG
ncbi:HAMP domain-containing sensor histidine kinase [Thermoleptolyngbya sichuanensis XZ-Cy5]|uniref:sensor histidine kinase n=1 Tax=Thermoleptolyngbya sichuanensis TaxID=2885951 RepID=UPI00240CF29F|nr:HAMP domain-containing sensor histidine kinase [Thermoleptolyngbya sichuanensis]MDG2616537.1 HAMP domain-containing sensor histidine kinase [Thermoleptolyngbya sichuanensis XZ-Cy5]